MKKNILFFCTILIIFPASTFSASVDPNIEERACLNILKENVKSELNTDLDGFFRIDRPAYTIKKEQVENNKPLLNFIDSLLGSNFTGNKVTIDPPAEKLEMNYDNFMALWKSAFRQSSQTDWLLPVDNTVTNKREFADILIRDPNRNTNQNVYKQDLYFYSPSGNIKEARRNNIGTIILEKNYIKTKFISFGIPTGFEFPYEDVSKFNGQMGESYIPDGLRFTDRNLYFHYLNDGTFVSCGYFRLKPDLQKGGTNENDKKYINRLGDLNKENYYSNVIPQGRDQDGGFEILKKNEIRDGLRFLVGKVGISSIDASQKPLMSIDVITVAYDNRSSYFNEYETFPLQVAAMTDADRYSSVNELQKDFLNRVYTETCLAAIHPKKTDLPKKCGGEYKSLSALTPISFLLDSARSILTISLDSFVPSVSARLEAEYVGSGDTLLPQSPILIDTSFPLQLSNKLDQIPDEKFRAFFRIATNPQLDRSFRSRQASGALLSSYEQVLLNCGFTFDQRYILLTDWLENLDVSKFDPKNITYSDPRLGDCVIPYPDVTRINTVIPDSFPSNQVSAQLANGVVLSGIVIQEPDYLNGVNVTPDTTQPPLSLARIAIGLLLLFTGCITLYFGFFRKNLPVGK